MAKKRRRRKMSLLTKVINVGVLLIAFSRPLQIFASSPANLMAAARQVAREATGDNGKNFNLAVGFYSPMIGAIVLKKAISMVRKTARV